MTRTALTAALLGLAACSADAPADNMPADDAPAAEAPMASEAETPAGSGSVTIEAPIDGSTIEGPNLEVTLRVEGISIVPAGQQEPMSGHHHIFLDADVTEPGIPIPSVPGEIVHMGDGSRSYTFEGVEPGEHRIIAVVGDWQHVPLQPWVVDTVMVTIR
jgi:hypothetical protein